MKAVNAAWGKSGDGLVILSMGHVWRVMWVTVCLAMACSMVGVVIGRAVGQVVYDRWLSPAPAVGVCVPVERAGGADWVRGGRAELENVAVLQNVAKKQRAGGGGAAKVGEGVQQDRA